MSFEIVCKFEIGRKLAQLSESKPFFFKSGVTDAVLKDVGKTPSSNDKLTNREMIGAKMSAHNFNKEVGIVSTADDFAGIVRINLRTSSTEQGFNVLNS